MDTAERAARKRAASWAASVQAASQGSTMTWEDPRSAAARAIPSRSGLRTTAASERASCSMSPGARVQAMTPTPASRERAARRGPSTGAGWGMAAWEGCIRTDLALRSARRAARRSKETTWPMGSESSAPHGEGGSSVEATRAVGWRWWMQIWRALPAWGRAARGVSVWTWTW